MKNLYFSLLIISLTGWACTNDNPDNPKQEIFPIQVPFTEYSLGESCWWELCDSTNNVIIINNNEELNNYITCVGDSYPAIDFSEQSLLLARGRAINGLRHLDIDFSKEATNEYALNVVAHTDETMVAPPLLIAITVPKIDHGAAITLNIQQNINDDGPKAEELSQENLCQAWVLIAKKQGDTVEKWQQDCFGDTPKTLIFDDSIGFRGRSDNVNVYQGNYEVHGDAILFPDVIPSTGVLEIPTWYRDYIQDLQGKMHKVSVFSHSQDADDMQLQLTSPEITLYFINKKWFKKTYFEFDELHP